VQAELGEIERDLTLRRLLWESSEELTKLVEEWLVTPFDQLNVENLQKNVNRFTQTVYMLEKGTSSAYKPGHCKAYSYHIGQGCIICGPSAYLKWPHAAIGKYCKIL